MQAGGGDGAALDGGIGGGHQTTDTGHIADAGNGAAAGFGAVLVVVHLVTGQVHQAQERRAGVQQPGDTLVGQQLAAFFELGTLALGGIHHGLLNGAEFFHCRQQGLAVLPVFLAVRVQCGFND